jgi:hypothetical protein
LGDAERVLEGSKPPGPGVGKGVEIPPVGWSEPIALPHRGDGQC